jgi:hypothetical protein
VRRLSTGAPNIPRRTHAVDAQVAQRAQEVMLQSQLEKSNVIDLMKPALRVLSDGR